MMSNQHHNAIGAPRLRTGFTNTKQDRTAARYGAAYAYAQQVAPADPTGLWADFALHYSRTRPCGTVEEEWSRWN